MATIVSKEGAKEALSPLVRDCISATRKEPGCISYELLASTEEPGSATFIEKWADLNALDAHAKTPHFLKFIKESAPYLAKELVIKTYEAKEL